MINILIIEINWVFVFLGGRVLKLILFIVRWYFFFINEVKFMYVEIENL